MAENKTKPNATSPDEFIANVESARKREDAKVLLAMCEEIVGEPAQMWGPSIIGCGSYHYIYESGREGDMCLLGFSPRKASLVVYIIGEVDDQSEMLAQLGKHKIGRACLYINKLADVDMDILRELMVKSVAAQRKKYPDNSMNKRGV